MEHQIHLLEKEAYCSVLRAFKAQSDAISWDKEGLMTELRKELRVSDDEHRELLLRVDNDDVIIRISQWRQTGGCQDLTTLHPVNDVCSPTPSHKRQRISQAAPSHGVPSMAIRPVPVQPSPSGAAPTFRGRKPRQFPYYSSASVLAAPENAMPGTGEELIGRKVLKRWPYDNLFYEASVTQYNVSNGLHALVYGTNTPDESFEWVNLMQIPPEDIRWAEDPGFSHRGHGDERSMGHGGALSGAGRNQHKNEQQNGTGRMTKDIEILHTDTLIKEVERIITASNPDRLELGKMKKMLKEHEKALIDAIWKLAYMADGDSGNELRVCI